MINSAIWKCVVSRKIIFPCPITLSAINIFYFISSTTWFLLQVEDYFYSDYVLFYAFIMFKRILQILPWSVHAPKTLAIHSLAVSHLNDPRLISIFTILSEDMTPITWTFGPLDDGSGIVARDPILALPCVLLQNRLKFVSSNQTIYFPFLIKSFRFWM